MRPTCARPGCGEPASTRLLFDPSALRVVLDTHIERWGGSGMLCDRHALRLTVPRGWVLDDQRVAAPRLFPVGRFDEARRVARVGARPVEVMAAVDDEDDEDEVDDVDDRPYASHVHPSQASLELPDERTPLLARAFEAAGSRVRSTSTLESLIPRRDDTNPAVAG